ncbi:hypothetical protein [Salinibacterium sp. PAMC 21357]|uniref:hypothetical protein n=1 Tax=Salinibacterium sp. PAMC 21357 TaxID=1112215 RepID=UPI0011471123|nr:hypothetical protein [Salinibacterium sp. PAMC 21357]
MLALAGCSSYFDSQSGYEEQLESRDDYQQSEEHLQAEGENYADQQPAESEASSGWRCYWDPTFDDDWHDDYLCSNGTNVDRPYLLPEDPFVESWEIDAAAAAYEDGLNR